MELGMTETKRRRKHRWLWWTLGALALVLAAVGILFEFAAHRAEPFLRALIVQRLQEHFHSRVELDGFHVSLADGLSAEGQGLRIWPPATVAGMVAGANAPGKPLIQIADFRFHAPLRYETGKPVQIHRIELRGVIIDVPPKPHFGHAAQPGANAQGAPNAANPPATITARSTAALLSFQVDTLVCNDAQLTLETSNPARQPLVFAIQTLRVLHVSSGGPLSFEAVLTNPEPRGIIHAKGSFGPWAVDDPGASPINGEYRFENAELGTFKGISGTLNSTGKYDGALRDMTVDGTADVPNFALAHFGAPMPLHTVFHAKVDGTNGDTWLEPVHATLGHTNFTAQGEVVHLPPVSATKTKPAQHSGHEIALNVDVPAGQIADFLHLTSHNGDVLLTGTLHMKTALEIPPGLNPVHERMKLKGSFDLDDVQFTSPKIQQRIADLSLRGQGKPKEAKDSAAAAPNIRSTMQSDFTMADAVITLPNLKYTVPGAEINLSGTYTVDGGGLDFLGTANMQATVSEMVGGWKGALLSPADRFFKHNGAGTKVKIYLRGTRQSPLFGVYF
jgi:hypothetical protein